MLTSIDPSFSASFPGGQSFGGDGGGGWLFPGALDGGLGELALEWNSSADLLCDSRYTFSLSPSHLSVGEGLNEITFKGFFVST